MTSSLTLKQGILPPCCSTNQEGFPGSKFSDLSSLCQEVRTSTWRSTWVNSTRKALVSKDSPGKVDRWSKYQVRLVTLFVCWRFKPHSLMKSSQCIEIQAHQWQLLPDIMSKWAVPNRLTILTSFQVELHPILLKCFLHVLHFSLEEGFRLVVYFCNALGKIKRTYSQPHSHVYLYSAVNLYMCIMLYTCLCKLLK